VEIVDNIVQGCLSGDDGGGIRFLNPGLSNYTVHRNRISHNVALHEGGGVSLNDAPYVYFFENEVVSNLATGTSAESNNNTLLAAGLATSGLSPTLKARLPADYVWNMSQPQDFRDNKFWDNRASNGIVIGDGTFESPFELQGLGMSNSSNAWYFDMGSADGGQLEPMDSIVQTYAAFCLPNSRTVTYGSFVLSPPFVCDPSLTSDATFTREVNWGIELTLQVLGVTVCLTWKMFSCLLILWNLIVSYFSVIGYAAWLEYVCGEHCSAETRTDCLFSHTQCWGGRYNRSGFACIASSSRGRRIGRLEYWSAETRTD
jgi:hypothetical protein